MVRAIVMSLAFRLARRELRGGVRGLWGVLLCLALGVAVIAAVGTVRASVDAGFAADGRRILGGDLEVESGAQALPDSLREWLRARGAILSDVTQMRSMLVAPSGERQLIELKAVDQAWPLVGAATLAPAVPLAQALSRRDGVYGLLAEPLVMDRLALKPGDRVRLGTATFRVEGTLTLEPDRVATPSLFGPRVLIHADALPETQLIAPGSLVRHGLRVIVPASADPQAIAADIRRAFPDQGWRVRDPRDAAPTVTRFIERAALFLTLVGLTSLLVGGIGVANGVRAWLDARARTIATLRCLGASPALVFQVCMIQVMALAGAGILAGVLVGATLPAIAAELLADVLPVPPVNGLYPVPLLLAAAFGLLIALCFALWPLGRAARIPGGALFREGLLPDNTRPSRGLMLANLGVAVALVGLTVATATDRIFAMWFCVAALGTLILFRLGALALMRLARSAPHLPSPWMRLGVANIYRPGAPTPLLLLSVGLGLSTLAAVALIQGNIRREILDQLPSNAPSFFFVDIQSDQLERFEATVRAQPGVQDIRQVPSMRARLVSVKGIPVEAVRTTPETAWALRGDRGLTYAATPPEGTRLVAGQWWSADYSGPPLVSFDAGLAKGWNVGLGDIIRVNILGRDIDLTIASLRDIAWQSLSLNFTMIASPGLLSNAPHTHIATVRIDTARQGALLRAVTDALPNVTGVRVEEVLAAVASLLNKVATALAGTGMLTLVSGAIVLVGAVAAGQRRRMQEAVILRALGATRRQIRAAWLVEFGILGLTAGLTAAIVGTVASFGVAHYILHTDWVFLPGTLILTLAGALATMLVFGYAGTSAALRARPASMLRNE
jgi:putative ABC transport system permease protein